MKPGLTLTLALTTGILFSGCFSRNTNIAESKMTYGAPKAYITNDPIPATTTDGPAVKKAIKT